MIEDSINGIKSAKSAGMICIAVPDKRLNQKEFQLAALIVDRLDKISIEVIKSLARSRITLYRTNLN